MVPKKDRHEITVQAVIINSEGRILLVHEKGEDGNKPAGWGMPGGGVDRPIEYLALQIYKFLPFFRINPEKWAAAQEMETEVTNPLVMLTLIKECLEETGLLVFPKRILFEEANAPGHKVVVISAEIVDGEIQKRSLETDDCDWFDMDQLPEGIYGSHIRRIAQARAVLGQEVV